MGKLLPVLKPRCCVCSKWPHSIFYHHGYHTKLISHNFLFPLSLCCSKNCSSLGKWVYNIVTISPDSGTVHKFTQELRSISRLCKYFSTSERSNLQWSKCNLENCIVLNHSESLMWYLLSIYLPLIYQFIYHLSYNLSTIHMSSAYLYHLPSYLIPSITELGRHRVI